MAGTFGDAAMFGFRPTKNITGGEGGIITTSDDVLPERLRLLQNHGVDRAYHHVLVGHNYRMTDVQGAHFWANSGFRYNIMLAKGRKVRISLCPGARSVTRARYRR